MVPYLRVKVTEDYRTQSNEHMEPACIGIPAAAARDSQPTSVSCTVVMKMWGGGGLGFGCHTQASQGQDLGIQTLSECWTDSSTF